MNKEDKDYKIIGLKVDDKYIYVAKTGIIKENDNYLKSDFTGFYLNTKIREKILNNKCTISILKNVDKKHWFDEKINKIVEFTNDGEKLLNAKHFCEGKRGYWQGKIKDKHTIKRLSESKHKKVVEYNKNGELVKVWESAKNIGQEIFKDYKVVNGSAKSKIYDLLNCKLTKNRLYNNSYWFNETEIKGFFKKIPLKLNIQLLIENNENFSKENRKKTVIVNKYYGKQITRTDRKTNKIRTFRSQKDAARILKLPVGLINKFCNNKKIDEKYIWNKTT